MKARVHPVVAVIVILLALVAVWFVYTRVFTGQVEGIIGPPSGASGPPPPGQSKAAAPPAHPAMPPKAGPPSTGQPAAKAPTSHPQTPAQQGTEKKTSTESHP